jgi:glucuronoxylan 4-O-methyltransferase
MMSELIALVARHFSPPVLFWVLRKATGTQITVRQLRVITRAIVRKGRCNLLIFGLGHDSAYWNSLNRGGYTLFLEDDETWIGAVQARHPNLAIRPVSYWTKQRDWRVLADAGERLALELPDEITSRRWDVIIVDAPAGWSADSPGRFQSIYTAARLCDSAGTVFVHDCEREAEAFWCDLVLTPARLVTEIPGKRKQGWLRQYRASAADDAGHAPAHSSAG